MSMERLKNTALVCCLFIVLVVIFSSYFRATEVGTFFRSTRGNASSGARLQSTCSEKGRHWISESRHRTKGHAPTNE